MTIRWVATITFRGADPICSHELEYISEAFIWIQGVLAATPRDDREIELMEVRPE